MHWSRNLTSRLIVPPGTKVSLKRYDPGLELKIDKAEAKQALSESIEKLAAQQDMLYAQDRWAVLVVLQAMDAAGKDGLIKHVMSGLNPQGCQVYSFKVPSAEERDHDYLWRSVKALPERGRIGIHNRSYYEEVLVARVHPEIIESQQLPARFKTRRLFQDRFAQINAFERYLVENGTVIVKLFLHVSREEQKKRFLERIDQPEKNWKFSVGDAKERGYWDDYMKAYEDVFTHTSTRWAPWYILPADKKWVTRFAAGWILYETLKGLDLRYPEIDDAHRAQLREARRILMAET